MGLKRKQFQSLKSNFSSHLVSNIKKTNCVKLAPDLYKFWPTIAFWIHSKFKNLTRKNKMKIKYSTKQRSGKKIVPLNLLQRTSRK